MTSLDRPLRAAVLRAVPSRDQRDELEPEIRALVADTTDPTADNAATGDAAERAALVEPATRTRSRADTRTRPGSSSGPACTRSGSAC